MGAIERFFEFIDLKGLKPTPLEKELGLSNGYLGKMLKRQSSIGSDIIEKIVVFFPDLNVNWLIIGKGEMLKTEQLKKIEVAKDCQICKEKEKVITAQKDTIALLKDKVENLNFRLREIEDKYYTPVVPEPKLKYKQAKK